MTSEYVCDHYQYYVGCWKPKHGIHQNIVEAVVMSLWPVSSKLGEISNMIKKQTTYTKNTITCSGFRVQYRNIASHMYMHVIVQPYYSVIILISNVGDVE